MGAAALLRPIKDDIADMGSLVCFERRNPAAGSVQRQTFDAEYVRRLAGRDEEVEIHFTTYFGGLLNAKLRSRLRSRQAIEDVKQETFLRVFTVIGKKGGIENPGALGAFVNSVCNNILFELYRKESKISELIEDSESGETGAEKALVNQQEQSEVREVLSSLPDKDQTILRWLFFEERDKDEVCRKLAVDREYLRVLVHRAKLRFQSDFLKRQKSSVDGTSTHRIKAD